MGVFFTSFIDILSCIFVNIPLLCRRRLSVDLNDFLRVNESSDIFISDFTLYFDCVKFLTSTAIDLDLSVTIELVSFSLRCKVRLFQLHA